MAKHPVLSNFILAIIVFLAGCYASLLLLDVFTVHGQEVKVPDVRFRPLAQATEMLDQAGLSYEIDSIYNEDFKPGIVIDQTPTAESMVKSTRTVYLTVNMTCPPMVELPRELTELPGADGVTLLQSLGFRNITVDTIPSDKADLILQISVNGHKVAVGTKAAVNARVTLSVGAGNMDIPEYDPLGPVLRDSLIRQQIRKGTIQLEQDSDQISPHIVY